MFERIKKESKTIVKVLVESTISALVWTTVFYLIIGPYNETFRNLLENIEKQEVDLYELCMILFGIFLVLCIVFDIAKVIITNDGQKEETKKIETKKKKRK